MFYLYIWGVKVIKNYDAIIFDMDGTLIDSMWMWKQIDIDFLAEHNIGFEDSFSKEIEGMSYTETAQFFIDKFEFDYTLDEIKKIWYDMAKDYLEHKVKLKDGISELLELIKHENIPMGIGTSASKEFADIALTSNNIMLYFETVVTSCEVEKGKPFPYVFLEVAKRLGVDPTRCLVFEDTEAGVDAALSAGMDVVAVHDASSEDYKKVIMDKSTKYVYSVRELFEIEKDL